MRKFAYIEALLHTGNYFINLSLLRSDSIHNFKIGLLSFLVNFVTNFDTLYWDFCSHIFKQICTWKQQVCLNTFASHPSVGLRKRRSFQLRKFMKPITLRLVWWFYQFALSSTLIKEAIFRLLLSKKVQISFQYSTRNFAH